MEKKTFIVEEANAFIPQLEELLAELTSVREQILAGAAEVEGMLTHASGNGGSKKASDYMLLQQRFQVAYTTLTHIGCELKDLNLGLVDFPSYRNGVLVYLCWKRGEARIEYWHDIDAGLAGRQPL